MDVTMIDTYYVYSLADSAEPECIRYIGQTMSMEKRLTQHRASMFHGPACYWKKAVVLFGRTLEMRLVDEVRGTRNDARACEKSHINRLRKDHRLMNAECFWSRVTSAGVQRHIGELYFSMLNDLLFFIKKPGKHLTETCRRLAMSVDRLETKMRDLMLCTSRDCFQFRTLRLRKELAAQRRKAFRLACEAHNYCI